MSNRTNSLKATFESLRKDYLQKVPRALEEAGRRWDSLSRCAWDPKELAELHRIIHSLTGSCAVFGLADLSDAARRLEKQLKILKEASALPNETLRRSIEESIEELCRLVPGVCPPTPDVEKFLTPSRPIPTSGERKVVFLVDDDLTQLKNLALQIGHFGYEVKTFSTLSDIEAAMEEDVPSVIIMDIVFPEGSLSGAKAIAQVQQGRKDRVPCIFISSSHDLQSRLEAVRAGGDAYFVKPLNIIELVDKLDALTTTTTPEPYRILIVEDEPELAAYNASILQRAGMATAIVNDPMQVFDALIEFTPDLILMDMYMPGCTGQELAKAIRQMGSCVSIPIVFLSAETNIDKQLTALRMGGDDFLTKPIEPEHLISSIAIRVERMRIIRSFMERDGLTGLLNHTRTKEQLDLAVARAERQNTCLAFAMIDIDHFKQVNDSYGHSTGDHVIVGLSRLLQQRLRKTDIIGRYGGEEFAVILMDTDAESAAQVLDSIRSSFSQLIQRSLGKEFTVTFSCGVASFPNPFRDSVGLSSAADRALYQAKAEGRNRVVISTA